MTPAESPASLRLALVEARIDYRKAELAWPFVEAEMETNVIAALPDGEKSLGANEATRKRALRQLLMCIPLYIEKLAELDDLHGTVDRLQAQLDNALDVRRDREIAAREKLADALLAAVAGDASDILERYGLKGVLHG